MKVYMHEYALDTNLLYSNDGRVVGVCLDTEDLQDNFDFLAISEKYLLDKESDRDEEQPLDFDDAA